MGRVTDMGHAVYAEGGIDYRDTIHCPFKTPEDVLSFNAVEEYGLPDIDERASFFQKVWEEGQKA
ncbi:MAG: uroporphyrinogen decarboxylase family protein, partial [bacterium]